MTLRPPAHCSSPEIAFAERCSEINIQRQNSGDSLPESNNPFLAMSSADLKDMEDEIDASSDSSSTDSDEVKVWIPCCVNANPDSCLPLATGGEFIQHGNQSLADPFTFRSVSEA